jgi:hypothetical protein
VIQQGAVPNDDNSSALTTRARTLDPQSLQECKLRPVTKINGNTKFLRATKPLKLLKLLKIIKSFELFG